MNKTIEELARQLYQQLKDQNVDMDEGIIDVVVQQTNSDVGHYERHTVQALCCPVDGQLWVDEVTYSKVINFDIVDHKVLKG